MSSRGQGRGQGRGRGGRGGWNGYRGNGGRGGNWRGNWANKRFRGKWRGQGGQRGGRGSPGGSLMPPPTSRTFSPSQNSTQSSSSSPPIAVQPTRVHTMDSSSGSLCPFKAWHMYLPTENYVKGKLLRNM